MKKNGLVKGVVIALSSIILSSSSLGYVAAAETTETTSNPWVEPYRKVVEELEEEYPDSELTYSLIYFNRGKNPELVAGKGGYWVSMYTYDAGEVYTVLDHWSYGAMGNAGYYYIPKKNILVNYNSDYAGLSYYTYYGKMKNHELVGYYKQLLRIDGFLDKDGDEYPDEDEILDDMSVFYYGEKRISEDRYNDFIIEGKEKLICGHLTAEQILRKLK